MDIGIGIIGTGGIARAHAELDALRAWEQPARAAMHWRSLARVRRGARGAGVSGRGGLSSRPAPPCTCAA